MKSFKNNREELEKIPRTSGLYYIYDENDKLLYIGKAKSLHARIFEHHFHYMFHRQGMFFRKILISKKLLDKHRKEWPEELARSYENFLDRGFGKRIVVMDYIFNKDKKVEIEEMPHELTKSKEKEMIQKLRPPLNYETASDEYFRLDEDLE